ncbi:MAG: aminotransferase, partial [Dermatophilaceae bacterium]|nr:aminotransferase [Dermatophilaceae bacterium]
MLDAAAGPLHPVARDTLIAAVEVGWADPARLHVEGRRAAALLDRARAVVAVGL